MKMLVLDEADELLKDGLRDKGFQEQIRSVFERLQDIHPLQVVLLSATMPPEVLEITTKFMHDPKKILVKADELTLEGIRQFYVLLEEQVGRAPQF